MTNASPARKRILTPRHALATLATCAVAGVALMGAAPANAGAAFEGTYQGTIAKTDAGNGAPLAGAVFEVEFNVEPSGNRINIPGAGIVLDNAPDLATHYDEVVAPSWDEFVATQVAGSESAYAHYMERRAGLDAELAALPTAAEVEAAQAAYDAWRDANGIAALEQTATDATASHEALVEEHATLDAIPADERTQEESDRLAVLMTELPLATEAMHDANTAVTAAFDANGGEGTTLRMEAANAANTVPERERIELQLSMLGDPPVLLTEEDVDRGLFESTVQTFEDFNTMTSNANHQAEVNRAAGLPTAPVSETPGEYGTTLTYHFVTDADGNIYMPFGRHMIPTAVTEIAAPEGYVLDGTRYEPTAADPGASFDVVIAGQRATIDAGTHQFVSFSNEPETPEEPPAPPVEPPVEPEEPVEPPVTPEEPTTPAKPTGTLAFTGSDSAPVALAGGIALAAAAAGSALAFLRRRSAA